MEKPIELPPHAKYRMLLRGASEDEIYKVIKSGKWEPSRQNRFSSKLTFDFMKISPSNEKFYSFKTVEVIFTGESDKIVVITVKVYYHN